MSAPNPPPADGDDASADGGVIDRVGEWVAGKNWRTSVAAAGMFACAGVIGVEKALPAAGIDAPPWLVISSIVCSVVAPLMGGIGLYHAADAKRLPSMPASPASPPTAPTAPTPTPPT